MLKSFKSFKSFKGNSNLLFQILCKSTAILLYRYEENIKNLLNRFCALFTMLLPLIVYPCYTFGIPLPFAFSLSPLAQHMLRGCYADVIPSLITSSPITNNP